MANFQYIATNSQGQSLRGFLQASDKEELAAKLQSKGLFLVHCKSNGEPATPSPWQEHMTHRKGQRDNFAYNTSAGSQSSSSFNRPVTQEYQAGKKMGSTGPAPDQVKGKVSLKELCVFTRQISISINAGMSLVDALQSIYQTNKNPKMAAVVRRVLDDILAGRKFSEALAAHPEQFSAVYISMAAAGEIGGFIPDALNRMAEFLEAEMELRRRVRSALVYPIIIAAVAVVVVTGMMMFIVPIFISVFKQMGAPLPLPTRMLVQVSHFCRSGGFLSPLAFIGLFFAVKRYRLSNESFRNWFDEKILIVPIFGKLILLSTITRFIRTFATLIGNGVAALQSVAIARQVVDNRAIESVVDELYQNIQQGAGLAPVFYKSKYFPVLVANMVSTGEKTGALPEVLLKVASYYESEVNATIQNLLTMLEPLIIVFMAIIVGFVVAGLLLPIINLSSLFS